MTQRMGMACAIAAGLWMQVATASTAASTLADEYAQASVDDQLILCAPVLLKQGGLLDIAQHKAQQDGDEAKAHDVGHAAFNISYRGRALQARAERVNPQLLERAWRMPGGKDVRATYVSLTSQCVALYNAQRKAGKISSEVEARALEKVRNDTRASTPKEVSPQCRSKSDARFDLCAQARAYADSMAQELPMRLNQNLSLTTVFAAGTRITMTALLAYDRNYLEALSASGGVSMRSVEEWMNNVAKGICAQEPMGSFIKRGGSVQYLYRFSDGSPYISPVVSTCS